MTRACTAPLLALLLGLGCKSKQPHDHTELLDALALVCEEAPTFNSLAAGSKDGPRPHADALTIWVGPEVYEVDGKSRQYTSLAEVLDALEMILGLLEWEAESRDGSILALEIAPDVPASRVAELLRTLELHDYQHVQIVLGRPSRAKVEFPDPRYGAEYVARLDAVGRDKRSTFGAEELKPLLDVCPAALEPFMAVAAAEPQQRCTLLIQGLREALPKCPNSFESDKVMSIVISFSAPAERWIRVAHDIDVDPSAPAVMFPADQTWAEWGPTWLESHTGPFAPAMPSTP